MAVAKPIEGIVKSCWAKDRFPPTTSTSVSKTVQGVDSETSCVDEGEGWPESSIPTVERDKGAAEDPASTRAGTIPESGKPQRSSTAAAIAVARRPANTAGLPQGAAPSTATPRGGPHIGSVSGKYSSGPVPNVTGHRETVRGRH